MDTERRLTRFRALKRRCEELCETVVPDLKAFMADDGRTFRSLPPSESPDEVSVASTCTCLMAVVAAGRITDLYAHESDPPSDSEKNGSDRAKEAFSLVLAPPWKSSNLPDDNPFTSSIVARTAGILATEKIGSDGFYRQQRHNFSEGRTGSRSIEQIVTGLVGEIPRSIVIESFPPHPTLAYWLVDAIARLNITLTLDTWKSITEWIARKFAFELARVTAGHDALMDPVALAMAACLCRRLRLIASDKDFEHGEALLRELPSLQELEFATRAFLGEQRPSGIWAKFFPLFRYRQAANYPFTFEILEAIIDEFGTETHLFDDEVVVDAFDKALAWCEQNRLKFPYEEKLYRGWNSGGDRVSLREGKPEVWATATVYIFAAKLRKLIENQIHSLVLRKYDASAPINGKRWDEFIDVQVRLPASRDEVLGLKQILDREIAEPYRSRGKLKRRTALLFGPPGTSKTTLVRAFASHFGWPIIEITPSHFLRGGLEKIYVVAEDVFKDLNDVHQVVIFFDEMDALVQRRDEIAHRLDVTQQFLTTSMLPHLAKLHSNQDIIFFMATNHQRDFDQAIKRPGRFDLLLCVGPPRWSEKKARIERFYSRSDSAKVRELLERWIPDRDPLSARLDLFTFDELRSLFQEVVKAYGKSERLSEALIAMKRSRFKKLVAEWHRKYITLRPLESRWRRNRLLKEYKSDQDESKLQ